MKLRFEMAAIVLAALCGCSSSTDPHNDTTADGFKVSIDVSPESPYVGQMVIATMIVENTTPDTLTRSFPMSSCGPRKTVVGQALSEGFGVGCAILDGVQIGNAQKMIVAPGASASVAWNFFASQAGTSTIVGCFPENSDALTPAVCVSKTVTVGLPPQ